MALGLGYLVSWHDVGIGDRSQETAALLFHLLAFATLQDDILGETVDSIVHIGLLIFLRTYSSFGAAIRKRGALILHFILQSHTVSEFLHFVGLALHCLPLLARGTVSLVCINQTFAFIFLFESNSFAYESVSLLLIHSAYWADLSADA